MEMIQMKMKQIRDTSSPDWDQIFEKVYKKKIKSQIKRNPAFIKKLLNPKTRKSTIHNYIFNDLREYTTTTKKKRKKPSKTDGCIPAISASLTRTVFFISPTVKSICSKLRAENILRRNRLKICFSQASILNSL